MKSRALAPQRPIRTLAVLAISGILGLCLIAMAGCSTPSPTEVTTKFLEAVKADDTGTIQETYSGDQSGLFNVKDAVNNDGDNSASSDSNDAAVNDSITNNLIPKLKEFDYEVSNETINGDSATVDVKVTTYAAGDACNSFISDYLNQAFTLALSGASQDKLNSLATSIFDSKIKSMSKTYTDTATISLTKEEGKWKVDEIDPRSDTADVFLGGLVSSINTIKQTYN